MDDVGWSLILLCIITPSLLFFTLNGLALRSFSRLKLQDAFRHAGREHLIDDFLNHAEGLMLTCGFFRIILNTAAHFHSPLSASKPTLYSDVRRCRLYAGTVRIADSARVGQTRR